MPKGSSQANQQYNAANAGESTMGSRANSSYNAVAPELMSEASNPTGGYGADRQ